MIPRRLLSFVFATCLAFGPSVADAQSSNLERAKTYFNAGAKAYEAGMFPAAIQAFEQAHKLVPKPAIIFTIGQAFRRQYYLDKSEANLREAIRHYRQYVQQAPHGRRRADAAQALAELEPIEAKLEAERKLSSEDGPDTQTKNVPATPNAPVAKTRLMITSSTPAARVSLDKHESMDAPFIAEVKKGRHEVQVTAPGFFRETRKVAVAEGDVLALDIRLRPKPAKLILNTEAGADVSVDGRYIGQTPFSRGIEVPSGTHRVTVLRNGRKAFAARVVTKRGQELRLDVPLESSAQRVTSWILLATSGTTLVAGAVFTGVGLHAQSKAQDIAERASKQNIGTLDMSDYNNALDERTKMRSVAFVSFASSVLFGGIGAWLYAYDTPSAPRKLSMERESESPRVKKTDPSAGFSEMSVSWVPVVTPGGVGVVGSF